MKVIKKLVSVLMAGVLTLSVMACSGTDKNKTARELDIETPVTVNVWYDNKDYDSYLENVAKEFKEANNLVTVNPVYVESSDFVDTINYRIAATILLINRIIIISNRINCMKSTFNIFISYNFPIINKTITMIIIYCQSKNHPITIHIFLS